MMFKQRLKTCSILTATSVILLLNSSVMAQAQKNVMFVLDASNSMWGQIDGRAKIDIAKEVLKDLAADMPADTQMGLIAYGHRFDRKLNECFDMELMNPIGHFSASEADNAYQFITPKGQTPIANVLAETGGWLEDQKGQNNTVVLISDGLESCDGDPCAAAKALNDAGVTTKIHVVGFDLSSEQRSKLECISKNGNGNMYAASNAASLAKAMKEVRAEVSKPIEPPVVVAQAPKVETPPAPELVFEDLFDGEDLAEGWDVINPNLDRYIAEEGELLIIAGRPAGSPTNEDMQNVMSHASAIPKGDWEIEVKFRLEMQHGMEAFYFGTRNDHAGWIAAGIRPAMGYGVVNLHAFLAKNESGNLSSFDVIVDSASDTSSRTDTARWKSTGFGDKYDKKAFVLTLTKTGRSYSMSGSYSNEGEPDYRTFKSENLKMLRGKKNLFIAFGLSKDGRNFQGEGNVLIDHVKIRKMAK